MRHLSDRYLILDRTDPSKPRWVAAKAIYTIPAKVPHDLDRPDGITPGTRWLAEFGVNHFAWLEWLFGHPMALHITNPGRESLATHITDKRDIPSTYTTHHNHPYRPANWDHI